MQTAIVAAASTRRKESPVTPKLPKTLARWIIVTTSLIGALSGLARAIRDLIDGLRWLG
jgi:hypothetical protein